MKCSIRGEKIRVTKAIEEYIETKLSRIDKYFKNEDIDAGQIFRVVEIQLGSFSRSLFSSSLILPIFTIEDILSGERRNIIRFEIGVPRSYAVNADFNPTIIIPFAECQGKPKGIKEHAHDCTLYNTNLNLTC